MTIPLRSTGSLMTSVPSTLTKPSDGRKPAKALNKEVFPDPFFPAMQVVPLHCTSADSRKASSCAFTLASISGDPSCRRSALPVRLGGRPGSSQPMR